MSRSQRVFLTIAVIALVIAGGVGTLTWLGGRKPAPPPVEVAAPAEPAPSLPASEPGPSHLIETAASALPLSAADIEPALRELLGSKAVMSFMQTDDFARRFVATVDNLGRAHVPARLWPVNPTPGRFTVERRGGGEVIAFTNSVRYLPFVLFAESVNSARAVDLYVRLYPQLQQAYQELGYPRGYFNDRLLEVIDLLLAAPEASDGLQVELTEVKGPIVPEQPWVRYQLSDAALESLPAGQKILLRVGPDNARRLKAKLQELRRELAKRSTVR